MHNARVGFIATCLLILTCTAVAADHYTLPAGSGNFSGTDWSNACKGFTGTCAWASMARGDTFYVGGNGHYAAAGTVSVPTSGTSLITIKGATASDHGTSVGWTTAMGVDVNPAYLDTGNCANYPNCNFVLFTTGYWTIDGQVASDPSNPATYGFQVTIPGCTNDIQAFYYGNSPGQTISHVTLRYIAADFSACGSNSITRTLSDMGTQGLHTNNTWSHFYCSGAQNCISVRAGDTGNFSDSDVIEYGYIVKSFSDSTHHGTAVSLWSTTNATFRYNQVLSCMGTGCLIAELPAFGAKIYGNVFANNAGGNNGVISATSGDYWQNTSVMNNTFASNAASYATFAPCLSGDGQCSKATGNVFQDNLVWNQSCAFNGGGTLSHDYNSYLSCSSGTAPKETNGQVATVNPFANAGASDFTLASDGTSDCASTAEVCDGVILNSPYNIDPDGVTRGADGTWERGAYEYVSGNAGVSPPTDLSASVQ